MIIAQITDIHLGFDPDTPDEFNRQRLDRILARLDTGPNRPVALLATGDLTDKGDPESYARLAEALAGRDWAIIPCYPPSMQACPARFSPSATRTARRCEP